MVPTHSAAGRSGVLVSGVVKGSSCRIIMLRQEELAFIKAISTLQLSLALLRELRIAISRRKKKPVVPAGSRSSAPGRVDGAPNDHRDSSRASSKPTSWQARATVPSPQTGAQHLALGPRLCPRPHLQSWA